MRAQGYGPQDIDLKIIIDDAAIAGALDSLENRLTEGDPDQWWQLSTEQIDLLVDANASTIESLQRETHAAAEQAQTLVLLYIGLALGALVAAILLAIAVLRQAMPLRQVTLRLQGMAAGNYDVQAQLDITGTDEISELAHAYNALTEGLAKLTLRGSRVARGEVVTEEAVEDEETIDTHGALAEAFTSLERSQAKLGSMAKTIAADDLQNPLLDGRIEGVLGESFAEMTEKLRGLAYQAHAIAEGQLSHPALATSSTGNLGTAFHEMIQSLRTLESQVEAKWKPSGSQVEAIAHDRLDAEVLQQEVPGDLGELVAKLAGDLSSMKEQLLVSERMSSMGMLAAGIGHEINNPLSYVLANVEWVHDELVDSGVDPEIVEALSEAKQGAQRVREITRDLNVFTRTQDGNSEPTNVLTVMESAVRMAQSQLRGHMQLHRDFANTPLAIANEGKLGQVFLNLIINASQSIPKEAFEQRRLQVEVQPSSLS